MFILIGWQDDDLPQFGEITDLLAIASNHFIAVKVYNTEGLDRHVHSYVILSTDKLDLISLCELSSYSPTVCHSVHRLYVTTKCQLIKC